MFLGSTSCSRKTVSKIEPFIETAEQGLAPAQLNLAQMYYCGDGVDKDFAQAHLWSTMEKYPIDEKQTKFCMGLPFIVRTQSNQSRKFDRRRGPDKIISFSPVCAC
jgi:hypothetical protein